MRGGRRRPTPPFNGRPIDATRVNRQRVPSPRPRSTGRPVTVAEGTNRLIDPDDAAALVGAVDEVLAAPMPAAGHRPELWDGHAAQRIVAVIAGYAASRLPPADV
jgi:hypothetical protein